MNKQQKTYGLLIAVLVIWGLIGYQIYTRLNTSTPELNAFTVHQSTFKKQQANENSFYEVKTEYRDPFLGKFPKKKETIKRVLKPKQIVTFPNVIYNGIIQGNTKSYILTINNKQKLIKLGQELLGVKLLNANSKQVVVKFQGIKKTISLQ